LQDAIAQTLKVKNAIPDGELIDIDSEGHFGIYDELHFFRMQFAIKRPMDLNTGRPRNHFHVHGDGKKCSELGKIRDV
jgi:hypothetical protein